MWPFDRRRKRQNAMWLAEFEAKCEWSINAQLDGYRQWIDQFPESGVWIEAIRYEWPASRIWKTGGEPDYMNCAGLWWRPREGPEIDQQVIDG